MKRIRSFLIPLIAALIACCILPPAAHAVVFQPDVRVLLSTSGSKLEFKLTGAYTLKEQPTLELEEELTLSVHGSSVELESGVTTLQLPVLNFESPDYGGTSAYIILRTGSGRNAFLGNFRVDVHGGELRVINTLPIEKYLYGVVPHEMSNTFPLEALKAQAVCARGYAVSKCSANRTRIYDILDTSEDQVYRGYASKNTRAIQAVDETRGQVLTYNGEIIASYYSASNGGQTELTGNVWRDNLPYYTQQDDPFDLQNPSSLEELSFIPLEFTPQSTALMDTVVLSALQSGANAKAGEQVELLATVWVNAHSATYDPPSRAYTKADVVLTARGSKGVGQLVVTLDLESLIHSDDENPGGIFNIERRLRLRGAEPGVLEHEGQQYPGFFLTNRRYGHGVGLSQRGAQQRATSGQGYDQVLLFYYTGTSIATVGSFEDNPVESSRYEIGAGGVHGLRPGTSAEDLLERAEAGQGTLSVVNRLGTPKEGRLVTGDYLRNAYGTNCFFDLPVIIFGDVDGTGRIDEDDVSALQRHFSAEKPLSGAYLAAADANRDGSVTLADMVALIRHINDDDTIRQGD